MEEKLPNQTQAAQGRGGVPVSGGILKPCGYGSWGHGDLGSVGEWWRSMVSEVFPNLNNPVGPYLLCSWSFISHSLWPLLLQHTMHFGGQNQWTGQSQEEQADSGWVLVWGGCGKYPSLVCCLSCTVLWRPTSDREILWLQWPLLLQSMKGFTSLNSPSLSCVYLFVVTIFLFKYLIKKWGTNWKKKNQKFYSYQPKLGGCHYNLYVTWNYLSEHLFKQHWNQKQNYGLL